MDNRNNDELIQLIQSMVEPLRKENEELRKREQEKDELVKQLNQNIANLNETVEYLTRKLYGKSSEKSQDPNQLNLFNEAEVTADPNAPEPEKTQVEGYARKKKSSRKESYAGLPIKEVVCHLPEEDQLCPLCGEQMKLVGKRFIREELQIIPAQVKLVHYYQEVYACPKCKKEDDEFVTVEAETPTALMKHSPASPSTVAWVMYQKYAMAVPLYRMEQDWLQNGVKLLRQTMANWVITCSLEYLLPVYERLHSYLLERDILHADEVPCQVLKEPGRPAKSKSYMWIYLTGNDGKPGIVLYDYHPGRKGEFAKEFLKGFHGYCHCDGYSGYNTPDDLERVGCYAHLRRKFFDAIPVNKEAGGKALPAEVGVDYCNQLFRLERLYKGKSAAELKTLRIKNEKPIVDNFYRWVNGLHPVRGSKLATAVTYAKNQRASLENYFKDGRLELSNSSAERKAKSYVIGRKNFLFHDTVDGAKASAVVYSIVETAKANNLNIFQYLQTLLLYMPDYKNEPDGIEDMMPWSEFIRVSCSKVEYENKDVKPKE